MPEDLVYEIDARIFRVVSEDAFHTMPMAMKHEPWVGNLHGLTQPLAQDAARIAGLAAITVQTHLGKQLTATLSPNPLHIFRKAGFQDRAVDRL